MAKFEDLKQAFAEIDEQKKSIDTMKQIKKDIIESTDSYGNVRIRLDRTGKIFTIDANSLAGLLNAKEQQLENSYNQLLNKITIK